jgi:hypothetical protein
MTEDATGPLGKVKAALAKATQAVVGIVKKDDDAPDAGNGTAGNAAVAPKERTSKMKDAVEAAKERAED